MANLSIGDSVRFKPGTKDYDLGVDIGGWQGRVIRLGQRKNKSIR